MMQTLCSDKANWAELLAWEFQDNDGAPLYQQVADVLRDYISDGRIPLGSRLPSTRQLMERLGVSRTTVINAYDLLHADGYTVCKVGSGTFVAKDALDILNQAPYETPEKASAAATHHDGLSQRGRQYAAIDLDRIVLDNVPFNTGVVRVDGRATAQWQHIIRRKLATEPSQQGYSPPQGSAAIRHEIAQYLSVSRGVRCTPEQVILVAGSQQAIDLAIKVLLDPGVPVWVEDPGYPLTKLALATSGMAVHAIAVDDEGIDVSQGIKIAPAARAAFITPSHQYPLGVCLSMRRRVELLAWAARNNAWVVEDDYDSEFRFDGPSLPALQGMDSSERVIYVGSFSKVLLPAMRYGYLVVPPSLVKPFTAARCLSDRHSPAFFEKVLTEFITQGYFVSHIRRMRAEYQHCRDVLFDLLTKRAGHLVDVAKPNQGLHLIAYLRDGLSDVLVAEEAQRSGVVVRPISRLFSSAAPRSGLMLGFAGYNGRSMETAVERLATILERLTQATVGSRNHAGSGKYPLS